MCSFSFTVISLTHLLVKLYVNKSKTASFSKPDIRRSTDVMNYVTGALLHSRHDKVTVKCLSFTLGLISLVMFVTVLLNSAPSHLNYHSQTSDNDALKHLKTKQRFEFYLNTQRI